MEKLQNHVNHSKLSFTCGAGAANINVFTGRVLFESSDISIGVNSHEMGITHIFDSQSVYNFDDNKGNGWRLNVQQYIKQSNEKDGNNQYLYLYIDAYGYVHKFEQFATVGNYTKYFDHTGLGLTLWRSSSTCYIEDAQGGKMYFSNISGVYKLIRIESGRSGAMIQYINYNDEGNIESVCDNGKGTNNRKFEFAYNEFNGLLERITCAKNNTVVEFTYNAQRNLVSVKKTVNATVKYSVSYGYTGKLLKYAVNIEDNTSLQFIYDDEGRAISVSDGVMKTEFNFSDPTPAIFASSSLYAGTNKYCGEQERKFLGYSISEDDSDFQQGETYSGIKFGSSRTTVKNGKGVETTYFFNEKGFTTGIVEKSKSGQYKTLFKQTGVCVSGTGTGDSINGIKATHCLNKYEFLSDKRLAADDFFKKEINKKNYDYVLSFWVKLESAQTQNVKARLCLKYKYADVVETQNGRYYRNYRDVEEFTGSSMLDCTAQGGWQYVTIPFSYVKSETTDSLFKAFIEICHIELENAAGYFDIADIRITPGRVPVFTLVNDSGDSVLMMEQVESIRYTVGGTVYGGTIAKDFFMSDSDIMQTCMELIKARASGNSSAGYTFVCNAGTKRVANVTKTEIFGNGTSVTLGFSTVTDENYSNKTFFIPNYKTATEPSSGDNRTYTFTGYNIVGGAVSVIRQHTHAIKYPDGAILQKESDEYEWQNLYGDTLKKRDAYGVTSEHEYDNYGNLIKTIVGSDKTDEKIITEYGYENKEYLKSTQNTLENNQAFNQQEYVTDPLYGTLTSTKQSAAGSLKANETIYTYNNFRDRLMKVELKANGVTYGKNTLTYGSDGRLCEVKPSENCKYGFTYDALGRAVSFSLNGVELLTKEYDYAGNSMTAKYHRSASETDAIKTTYDKYGRVKSVKNNNANVLTTTYQDEAGEFEESPSCANVKTVKDGITGANYAYTYDPYTGRPTEYNVQNSEMSLKVFSAGSDKVKYEFDNGDLNYEDQITYDEDCLISPRIVKAYNNSDWGMDWNLSYDELGRYSGRKEDFNFMFGTCPNMTISYKRGTFLKEQIEYKKTYDSTTYKETIKQEYDARGNILSIEDANTFSYFKGTNKSVYEYDDINRLIKEEVTGKCDFTREYTYDEEGNIATVKQGNETETYTYSQGRLKSIASNKDGTKSFSYDIFGNPTHYKSATRNMWWERGTLLKQYGDITYTYDGHGNLYKKEANGRTWINYYDGNKLIAQKVGDKIIRYFYDIEGVVGFKIGTGQKYMYGKDAQGNVVSLYHDYTIVAKYVYDAWGNCTVLDKNGNEITDWDDPAVLNPIRWKSQYYDADSGLYWIGQRWYDPETGRYISTGSPESLIENASVIFALNLYALCTSNPVAVMFAASTFLPSLDFYYNGEYKTWWEKNSRWVLLIVGVVATITACIAAPFTCGATAGAAVAIQTTLANILIGTAIGAAVSLAIGGTIAGVQAALTGHGFWQAFGDSVSENFVDAVVTSFAFTAVTIAASNLIQTRCCFKEGTLVETEDGLKPIEEIEVGDKVLAYDEETGEQAYKEVKQLFRNETKEWYHVQVNGEEIVCTGGHPFYVLNATKDRNAVLYENAKSDNIGKWITAKELKHSDKLLLSDGTCAIIEEIEVEQLEKPETTYNFEVVDFHTYYVAESNVLVHNECWKTQKEKYWKNEAKELKGKDITYEATQNNIKLMKNGKAPIGLDGKPVELHHIQGRGVDKIVQMQQTVHRGAGTSFHATEGFKGFRDITTLSEWSGKYV